MIRYEAIGMGACCQGRCGFCRERGGAYRDLDSLLAELRQAHRPLNLYFSSGHAAGNPALAPLASQAVLEGARRLKVKVSGAGRLDADLLALLLARGVMIYEIECLGPTAAVHDGITGIKASFRGVERTLDLLVRGTARTRACGRPFVSVVMPVCEGNVESVGVMKDRMKAWRPDRLVFLNTGTVAVSRVVFELRSSISALVVDEVWPVLSGFPFCAIPGLEHFAQELYDRQVSHPAALFCQNCLFSRHCCGVSGAYLAEHGAADFHAVVWHRYQEDLVQLMDRAAPPSAELDRERLERGGDA